MAEEIPNSKNIDVGPISDAETKRVMSQCGVDETEARFIIRIGRGGAGDVIISDGPPSPEPPCDGK